MSKNPPFRIFPNATEANDWIKRDSGYRFILHKGAQPTSYGKRKVYLCKSCNKSKYRIIWKETHDGEVQLYQIGDHA